MSEAMNDKLDHGGLFRGSPYKGLTFLIIVNMALVMLTAIVLTFLIVFRITSINLTRVEARRAEDTMRSLQVSVSRLFEEQPALSPESEIELKVILNQLISRLDLESVVVVDSLGRIVTRLPPEGPITMGGGEPDLRRAMGGQEMVTTEKRRGFGFFSSGIEELSVSVPIVVDNKIKGGIKARFSMRLLNRNIILTQSILIGFIVITTCLIVLAGVILLSQTVIKPLHDLIEAHVEFAAGKMDRRVKIEGANEVAQLAGAFNTMAERIQTNQRQLLENLSQIQQVNRDLERTRVELLYSEKLAGVGQLAQGVAHEIGNPLSAVLGYLELTKRDSNMSEKTLDYIERSEREIARINVIIRELLDYSRPSAPDRKPLDVDEVISSLLTLVTGQKRFGGLTFRRNVQAHLPPVFADRSQLVQVLVNLAFNAADATSSGGTLEVGAALRKWEIPVEENTYTIGDLNDPILPGTEVVQIWVADSGIGITKENITKIFDPFFTTKEPGTGTGLGLAICARIIEGFGGRLTVQSSEGKGSIFTITFPLSDSKESHPA